MPVMPLPIGSLGLHIDKVLPGNKLRDLRPPLEGDAKQLQAIINQRAHRDHDRRVAQDLEL
jgi:hypothetical protein